ncbi:neuropeptide B [Patagioenas fasciata monilis]|uniref:Neuropeptide B n=1 Tax=Patagioenas fasciata monilis TaxID=372326 RepID=A0A1V4JVN4_PATFA|nr:neuropeptide B [Patagioenas fasciata monilis]
MRAVLGLGLLCLWLLCPAEPWYRPPGGPRLYSVGRAAGLLSGFRRAPHACRSHTDGPAERGPGALLPAAASCVTDVAPELQSCRLLPGAPGALRCRADVTVSLDPGECAAG